MSFSSGLTPDTLAKAEVISISKLLIFVLNVELSPES